MFTRIQFEKLLELPSPILTVYIHSDLAEASTHRPTVSHVPWLKDEMRNIAANLTHTERAELVKQVKRVEDFLQHRISHERSLVIFAGPNIWETIPLQADVNKELHWGTPAVSQLSWLASEHKPYGLVAVDHTGARFFVYWLGELIEHEEMKFNVDVTQWKDKDLGHVTGEGVRKTRGSQRDTFEKRLDSNYARLCGQAAHQASDICAKNHLTALFLIGPERLINTIKANLPPGFGRPVMLLDQDLARLPVPDVLKHVEPQIADWERQREAALVTAVTSAQRGAITGVDETLAQLQRGGIRTVVLAKQLDSILHQCVQCGWTDRSAGPVCSICGGKRRTVTLRDTLPQLARANQADIETVSGSSAEQLNKVEGIAGWLRQMKKVAEANAAGQLQNSA